MVEISYFLLPTAVLPSHGALPLHHCCPHMEHFPWWYTSGEKIAPKSPAFSTGTLSEHAFAIFHLIKMWSPDLLRIPNPKNRDYPGKWLRPKRL